MFELFTKLKSTLVSTPEHTFCQWDRRKVSLIVILVVNVEVQTYIWQIYIWQRASRSWE